jgi:hypothetical protein
VEDFARPLNTLSRNFTPKALAAVVVVWMLVTPVPVQALPLLRAFQAPVRAILAVLFHQVAAVSAIFTNRPNGGSLCDTGRRPGSGPQLFELADW